MTQEPTLDTMLATFRERAEKGQPLLQPGDSWPVAESMEAMQTVANEFQAKGIAVRPI